MKRIVILFSGGADSVYLVELAKELKYEIFCVMVDYEQLHAEELDVGMQYLQNKDIPYRVVEIKNLCIQSGLTGIGKKGQYENVNEWHVPGRNLMFISIAAAIAESKKYDAVWIGANKTDIDNNFIDCRPEFFSAVSKITEQFTSHPVIIEAPLTGLNKDLITTFLQVRQIKYIFSGYGHLA